MESGNSNNGQHRHRHRQGDRLEKTENHRQKRSLMVLAKAQVGDRLWIAGYESKEGIERLLGMGLAPGMAIEVVQNLAGNLLIAVGETRIGIDGGMAKRILVSDKPFDYLVEGEHPIGAKIRKKIEFITQAIALEETNNKKVYFS